MFLWIITALAVIGIDQLTKYLTVTYLKSLGSVPLWQDVLHLTYVENTGAAFGMLKGHRWLFMIVSGVAIVAMAAYMVYICRRDKPSPLLSVAMGMVIGGGIGNMIDRIAAGYVVDFIDFTLINFAVFNAADSFVCIGAGLLFLWVLFGELKTGKSGKNETVKAETAAKGRVGRAAKASGDENAHAHAAHEPGNKTVDTHESVTSDTDTPDSGVQASDTSDTGSSK